MATTTFLGCRTCGRPVQDHDVSVVHRFVRRRGRTRAAGGEPLSVAAYLGALGSEADPQARLQRGAGLLPALVEGCDHASVTTTRGRSVAVRVASDSTSRRADELQDELGVGPCLQAARTGYSVVAHDLGTETRWLAWSSAVATELRVRSVLSVLLIARVVPVVTLNLYSDSVDGLSVVDLARLHTLAGPLTDALLDVRVRAGRLGPAA